MTGKCEIEGYAENNSSYQMYRFMNQTELSTLEGCQLKLQKITKSLEQCFMIPMGRVSHVQMTFTAAEEVKSINYINANCNQPY